MDVHEELERLGKRIEQEADKEQLYIERAKLYWKLQDLPRCLADYDEAINLNHDSEAVHLRTMVMRIMNFYNKDMYNP